MPDKRTTQDIKVTHVRSVKKFFETPFDDKTNVVHQPRPDIRKAFTFRAMGQWLTKKFPKKDKDHRLTFSMEQVEEFASQTTGKVQREMDATLGYMQLMDDHGYTPVLRLFFNEARLIHPDKFPAVLCTLDTGSQRRPGGAATTTEYYNTEDVIMPQGARADYRGPMIRLKEGARPAFAPKRADWTRHTINKKGQLGVLHSSPPYRHETIPRSALIGVRQKR
jgi:hypothetical protein